MKKKFLFLVAIVAAGVLALTACTSSEHTSGTNTAVNNAVTDNTSDNNNTVDTPAENTQEEMTAPEQGEPGYDGEPDGEVIPDADAEAAEQVNTSADIWSGSYEDSDESVSIQLQEDGNISFTFAQSGIYGTAQVNGTQAVFHGDDYHVVVFQMNGDTLSVSVSSEEDFDASASPLNGTYEKR